MDSIKSEMMLPVLQNIHLPTISLKLFHSEIFGFSRKYERSERIHISSILLVIELLILLCYKARLHFQWHYARTLFFSLNVLAKIEMILWLNTVYRRQKTEAQDKYSACLTMEYSLCLFKECIGMPVILFSCPITSPHTLLFNFFHGPN